MSEIETGGGKVAEQVGGTGVSDATCDEVRPKRDRQARKRKPRPQGRYRPGCASIPETPPGWWLRQHRMARLGKRGLGHCTKGVSNFTA